MARRRAASDDLDPDEIVSMTVAIGDGEWLTLTPVGESAVHPDEIEVDLDMAARRLLLVRSRAALDELDGPRWPHHRSLDA